MMAGPRASLSPRVQTVDDKRKGLQKSLDSKRRSPAGLSSLLVGFVEKKREKGYNKSRVFVFEYKIKIEYVCNDFENLPKIDSRGFKHDQRI
jgi:hypothetical protein